MRLTLLYSHRLLIGAMMVLALYASYQPLARWVNDGSYDLFAQLHGKQPLEYQHTLRLVIDQASIEAIGPWPWPRHQLAELISRADKLGARTIGLAFPLPQHQPIPSLDHLRNALELHQVENLLPLLEVLNGDQMLAESLQQSGKVILLSQATGEQTPYAIAPAANNLPQQFHAMSMLLAPPSLSPLSLQQPLPLLALQAHGVGFDGGDKARFPHSPLLALQAEDKQLIPSFLLSAVTHFRQRPLAALAIDNNAGITDGKQHYATDISNQFHPLFSPHQVNIDSNSLSAITLLDGTADAKRFKDKLVLIGLDIEGETPSLRGPAALTLSPLEWQALTLEALLQQQQLNTPYWSHGLERLLIIAFALLLILLPARFQRPGMLWISLLLAIVTLNLSLLLMLTQHMWLPLAFAALFIVIAHPLVVLHRSLFSPLERLQQQLDGAFCEIAHMHQTQGQLDQAFTALRQAQSSPQQLERLYEIGLDFERRRQFAKASSVYDCIAAKQRGFRDIQQRISQLRSMPQTLTRNGNSVPSGTATIVIDASDEIRPVIGRYQIEKELGRGAMGTVFLGKDPKIGRTVAIKTLSLTDEFEAGQLDEARRRFYQEAETAGQLNHPNIVTIYDAGEEHDLAYIAMDYVSGVTLDTFKQPDKLLPLEEVFAVGIKIADALDYAHQHKVVHRDIKPANIIYDRDTGHLKVTDFGIAYLTDNSKTRSGTVIGSPYYMSPEQLAGRKVDGRADIFSLGVTLYELFTGELPFQGDGMANLMYSITHDKQQSVRKLRPELPTCLVRIINKCLAKEADQRYAHAAELKRLLSDCLQRQTCSKGESS